MHAHGSTVCAVIVASLLVDFQVQLTFHTNLQEDMEMVMPQTNKRLRLDKWNNTGGREEKTLYGLLLLLCHASVLATTLQELKCSVVRASCNVLSVYPWPHCLLKLKLLTCILDMWLYRLFFLKLLACALQFISAAVWLSSCPPKGVLQICCCCGQ